MSDWEKPTGTWPAMTLATSEIGPDASSSSVSVTTAPEQAHEQPSKMNGQRTKWSEAPTRRMISISWARDMTAIRMELTTMSRTVRPTSASTADADGAQGRGDADQLVDVLLLLDDVGDHRAALGVQDAHHLARLAWDRAA